jgi:hypothetical protein
MDFRRVTHRGMNQLLVILGVQVRAVRRYAVDSPHGLVAPFL